MSKNKTFILLFFSAITIILLGITISCTSNVDMPEYNISCGEEHTIEKQDTIYIETEAPIVKISTLDSVSEKTLNIINSLQENQTRSSMGTNVFFLYDEWTEKWAYAVENPNTSNSWIFECYSSNTQEALIILFEQIDTNEFITRDENGNILRYFLYDSGKRELWTYNDTSTRSMSTQDKILCNSMFAAASYLVCEALAVPTAGGSLLVGLGFAVVSTYICD